MHVINHRQHGTYKSAQRSYKKRILRITGVIAGVFVLANVVMFALYFNKALPHYSVGFQAIGGKNYDEIDSILQSKMLPDGVTLSKANTKQVVPVTDLGISVDRNKTMQAVKSKPLVPLVSLVRSHTVPLVLSSDLAKVTAALVKYDAAFSKAPTDKHIGFNGTTFEIQNAEAGYTFDEDKTASNLITAIADGKDTMQAVVTAQPAGSNDADLSAQLTTLQKQLQTKITLNYQSQKVEPSAAEIGSWYVPSGATMAPSAEKIGTYIDNSAQKFGVTAANRSDLVTAITYVLSKNISSNLRISATGNSTVRTYCTNVNGMPTGELSDLIGKLAATYADTRGWNDNGAIAFKHVESGCGYTVVLAASSRMTSYGAICDNYYNCQVGTNVIVNGDRWLYATDPWNKTGQSVEAYRQLVINHETGHRLGFRDNNVCSGPGQPAPVMSQQSIDLLGCSFNVWPLQSELDNLKSML